MALPDAIPLAEEDRAILALECATVAGHTCKVARVGPGAGDVERLRERIAARIGRAPLLSRRLGGSAEAPAWVPDPAFALERHVVALERPLDGAGREALRAAVARLFEQRLPRDRPLWRIDVAPLPDGGSVLVWRIHHALADGTAALRYARALLWDEPGPAGPAAAMGTGAAGATGADAAAATGAATTGTGAATTGTGAATTGTGAAAAHGTAAHEAAAHEAAAVAAHLAEHAADEERRRRHLAAFLRREYARSLARSPFDGAVGRRREVGLGATSLRRLHDAARALGGATVNDAVLTVVAGALRRWLERHGEPLEALRVRVPVSLHHEGDEAANRDSFFGLPLPLEIADPAARLRAVHAETAARKAAGDAGRRADLLERLDAYAPPLRGLAGRLERSPHSFALSVSNVPGPREAVHVLGAPVQRLHSLAEIGERHALRIAVVSLGDLLCFGFCADPALVPDVQAMADAIEPEARALAVAAAG